MAASQAKKEWEKAHTVFVGLKLNKNTDASILKKLETVGNRQGYIKDLISQDIRNDQQA